MGEDAGERVVERVCEVDREKEREVAEDPQIGADRFGRVGLPHLLALELLFELLEERGCALPERGRLANAELDVHDRGHAHRDELTVRGQLAAHRPVPELGALRVGERVVEAPERVHVVEVGVASRVRAEHEDAGAGSSANRAHDLVVEEARTWVATRRGEPLASEDGAMRRRHDTRGVRLASVLERSPCGGDRLGSGHRAILSHNGPEKKPSRRTREWAGHVERSETWPSAARPPRDSSRARVR